LIILEKEWYERVELKVKQLENNIKKANTQTSDDDSKLGIYYGPMGEA
jgi:predicted  nucleic acid-binding Zn-ribbon protein